ncbi:hypothetical protein [Hydrogenibacillus sp. N12]|uniref:hypothetical protein n=1 Tax=Hydrogenibacillus sp. N12 TaxID=2866627 RepID=UPI001C7D53F2|nr:hypothetical protein [Hydrogenibacillus sp. N12]QZA32109.1 hypothetical protein K2M58_07105 [Hydrogenibacillus sp. N12]
MRASGAPPSTRGVRVAAAVSLLLFAAALLFWTARAALAPEAEVQAWLERVRPALPEGARIEAAFWYRGSRSLLAVVTDGGTFWFDETGRPVGRFAGRPVPESAVRARVGEDFPDGRLVRLTPGFEFGRPVYEAVVRLKDGGVGYAYYDFSDGRRYLLVRMPPG